MPAPHDVPADFDHLTPDAVIDHVEDALGVRCANICRPLNSYINRVYDVQQADGTAVIAKFYRPGRWSPEALQDEHDFLHELAEAEIPVIAPLPLCGGGTLRHDGTLHYALFPKKGGRVLDEPTPEQWVRLGRLLGRVHLVGAGGTPRDRVVCTPRELSEPQLETILASGHLPAGCADAYERAARGILERIGPLFADAERIRIHGDGHGQNVIERPGEGMFLIDFDDMAVGPPVQDLWMFLPGRLQDALPQADALMEGYTTFRPFDPASWRLVEPLRAMRFIHFTAWCARQAEDRGFARLSPDFGTPDYWRRETRDLETQRVEIEDALDAPLPF